jgi:hypothetical protein
MDPVSWKIRVVCELKSDLPYNFKRGSSMSRLTETMSVVWETICIERRTWLSSCSSCEYVRLYINHGTLWKISTLECSMCTCVCLCGIVEFLLTSGAEHFLRIYLKETWLNIRMDTLLCLLQLSISSAIVELGGLTVRLEETEERKQLKWQFQSWRLVYEGNKTGRIEMWDLRLLGLWILSKAFYDVTPCTF